MKQLPETENPLVLRTDRGNDLAWARIRDAVCRPSPDGYLASVQFVDDPAFHGLSNEQLLERIPPDYEHSFLIVADATALASTEHPLSIVDLDENPGTNFRAIPSQIQSIENNLSIANMDFEEFADAVDEDGIFRGFADG